MKKGPSILIALTAVAITVAGVWYTQRPIAAKPATWDDVIAEAGAGGYRLITTEALADRYRGNPADLLLVDTRQPWEFRTGHIDGALNFSMEPTAWARWRSAGPLETFLGPDKQRTIIFY